MNRIFHSGLKVALSSLILSTTSVKAVSADEGSLRGPLTNSQPKSVAPASSTANVSTSNSPSSNKPASMGGLSAPGADAVMTPDLLLMKPKSGTGNQVAEPLKSLTGLTLSIDKRNIDIGPLHGLLITINNQTNRPLMVDGDKATVVDGGNNMTAAPLVALQKAVEPPSGLEHAFESIGTIIIPAAATVGGTLAVRDELQIRKPVLKRYGPDEKRRQVESARFGRRILWPQQKTQGIVYFLTASTLDAAQISIPAATLFDVQDKTILSSNP